MLQLNKWEYRNTKLIQLNCRPEQPEQLRRSATKHRIGYIGHIVIKLYLYVVLGVQESSNCYVYVSICTNMSINKYLS